MRTGETFKVGGHEYQVNMWHPDKAIRNLTWLTKMCGEGLLGLLMQTNSVKDLMDSDVDTQLLYPALKALLSNLNERNMVEKVNEILDADSMLCDGKPIKYETHFMGRTGHLLAVLAQIIKVQYSDFFDVLPANVVQGAKKSAAGSESLTPAH
jgi:hypothetical protein